MKNSNKIKKSITYKTKKENRTGYLFLSPWLVGFLIFTVFPVFYTFFLSFHEVRKNALGWQTTFIGIDNYALALLQSTTFVDALVQFLLVEAIYSPAIVIISFILAILLNQKIKFRTAFRIIYFLPVIVLSGSVMQQLMSSGGTEIQGVNDIFVFRILVSFSPFLARGLYILFQNFTMVLWFTGIPIILFINSLQKINGEMYEAAKIDGATAWQALWKITIPIIKPIALVVSLFTIVQLGTYPIHPLYGMVRDAIDDTSGGLGLASAYAYIYGIGIFLFIGIAFLLFREKEVIVQEAKRRRR